MKRVVLAVDPGKASGICCLTFESGFSEPELIFSAEEQPDTYATSIRKMVAWAQSEPESLLEIVCERFTINAQTVKNSQAPYSLEQIGVLKQIMRDFGINENTLKFQSPSDAKRMFPNEALKKLGYWHRGGEGHALDAVRHGLLYLAKNGWTPLRLLQ